MDLSDGKQCFSDGLFSLDGVSYQLVEMRELMDSFHFDLSAKLVAVARFGGTLAVCRDIRKTEFFELSDPLRDHICFYSNHGLFQNKVRFDDNTAIVGFDFIFDELLVVVLENGQYFLIDPFEQDATAAASFDRVEQFEFGRDFASDPIIRAKVFRNGIALQTSKNRFYYKPELVGSQLCEFKDTEDITGEVLCWTVVAPEYAHFEVHVALPSVDTATGGILCLSEDQSRTHVMYNGVEPLYFDEAIRLNLLNVRAIACADNGEQIAYLTNQRGSGGSSLSSWVVHIVSTNVDEEYYRRVEVEAKYFTQDNLTKQSTSSQPPPMMYWVRTSCVAIQIGKQLILVGSETASLQSFNMDGISQKLLGFVCLQEADCLKIVSQKKILLLRPTPQSFLNVFAADNLPAKRLYEQAQKGRREIDFSSSTEDIRNDTASLAAGVRDCVIAGAFEVRRKFQQQLLKAASFGKIFLQSQSNRSAGGGGAILEEEEEDNEQSLTKVCKFLRVAHQLNSQKYSRTLTFAQVSWLDTHHPETLVKIMLRYNLHYIATQVISFLHLSPLQLSAVYVHWAQRKIESNEDDQVISETIQKKLLGEPNISFTDIAHKALSVGKPQIALQLLVYEPCIQKRIPVLLWMAKYLRESKEKYFEKALVEALSSKDSSLIYLVIRAIWDSSEKKEEECFRYFSKEEVLSMHFQKFLRAEESANQKMLYSYLVQMKQSQKAAFFLLEQTTLVRNHGQLVQLFEEVKREFMKDPGDKFNAAMMDEHVKLMKHCEEDFAIEAVTKTQQQDGWNPLQQQRNDISLSLKLQRLFTERKDRAIEKIQAELKVSEKRINFTRLRALIYSDKPADIAQIEPTIDQINKRSVQIPYEMIVDHLLTRNQEVIALRTATKISDEHTSQIYLEKTLEAAISKKSPQLLIDISRTPDLSSHLRAKIQAALASTNTLNKQKY